LDFVARKKPDFLLLFFPVSRMFSKHSNMDTIPAYLRTSYPFEPHWLRLPDGRMHYVDTGGNGDVILLLHGNPSWSFLWRDLIRSLALQGFRCIAPDHLGMGLSEKPKRFFRIADRVAHVSTLLETLGIERYHLCVHDWGGAIGFGVAGRTPERVQKIVVTNSAAFPLPKEAHLSRRIALFRIPGVGEFLARAFNAFAWPATFLAVRRRLSRTVRAGFLAPYDSWRNRAAVAHFVQDIPLSEKDPSWPVLCEIEKNLEKLRDKPVLLAWGGREFCFNDAFLLEWKRRFPNARIRYYTKAGHYVLEDAGETLIPEIREFLEE
jgi:haloalkane dehalogenase